MAEEMKTGQKISITVFIIALAAFFYFSSEMLVKHSAWSEFQTPAGVGEVFGMFASVTGIVGAALGIDVAKLVSLIKK